MRKGSLEQRVNWKGSTGRARKGASAAWKVIFQRVALEKEMLGLFGHRLNASDQLEELSLGYGLNKNNI